MLILRYNISATLVLIVLDTPSNGLAVNKKMNSFKFLFARNRYGLYDGSEKYREKYTRE